MPPHTISPTSSSQGLGISYSTLSPPPNSTQPHGFTGMGINPRPTPSASSPQRSHGGPPSPVRATPPRQPQFALRPTHTRGQGSKGFASFSALPPTDAPPSYHPTSPVRRLPVAPGAQGDSLSSVGTSVSARKPIRKDSKESLSSQGGTGSSRGPRRSKSIDLLRRLSRNGHDTIGGERYVPLSGEDLDATHAEDQRVIPQDEGGMDSMYAPEEPVSPAVNLGPPVEVTPKPARRPLPRQPSSNTVHSHPESHFGHAQPAEQSGYYDSQIHSTVDQRTTEPIIPESPAQAQVGSPELSSASSHGFQSRAFPHPPSHPPRSATAFSDPTYHTSEYSRPQPAYMMLRSMSQPLNLQSVRESDRELLSARTSDMGHDKRVSQVSTGIHSKNAVLLSAESGGMMLAFSPGEGRWRQGEEICGTGTGLIPTPQLVPMPQMAEEDPDSELKARPWSESTMSQHGLLDFSRPRRSTRHESTDGPNPPFLRSHGRSHSDGAAILARQGTLFYPSTSNQRASQELGVMLGGRSRRLSANKVLSPPVLNGWEQAGGQVPDKVRLEAAKKRKARVEVDVVLEREAVVEGGEIRGRMEVRVTGGKRSEGLRIGGGKIRVVGFEGESSLPIPLLTLRDQLIIPTHLLSPPTPSSRIRSRGRDERSTHITIRLAPGWRRVSTCRGGVSCYPLPDEDPRQRGCKGVLHFAKWQRTLCTLCRGRISQDSRSIHQKAVDCALLPVHRCFALPQPRHAARTQPRAHRSSYPEGTWVESRWRKGQGGYSHRLGQTILGQRTANVV